MSVPPDFQEKLPPQVAAQLQKRFSGAIAAAKEAQATSDAIEATRERAANAQDSAERFQAEAEVQELEKKYKHQIKVTKRLESGALQGAGAGAGIGAATGLGVGTVVGTLVGGVTAIPTTILGGLVGAGTGAIHGPWVKFSGQGSALKANVLKDLEQAKDNVGQKVDGWDASKQKETRAEEKQEKRSLNQPKSGKKAPRKLEIRKKPQ